MPSSGIVTLSLVDRVGFFELSLTVSLRSVIYNVATVLDMIKVKFWGWMRVNIIHYHIPLIYWTPLVGSCSCVDLIHTFS